MSELLIAAQWLYSTLRGDAALLTAATNGIYEADSDALDSLDPPYVVYQFEDGHDVMTVGAERIYINASYLVRAVVKGDALEDVVAMADRIDTVLHKNSTPLVVTGVTLGRVSCYREKPFEMRERFAGATYRHLGGFYRILLQEI